MPEASSGQDDKPQRPTLAEIGAAVVEVERASRRYQTGNSATWQPLRDARKKRDGLIETYFRYTDE